MSVDPVDTYIQSALQRHHIPGLTVAVLQHGVVIKHQAYGLASLEFNVPMTVTTRHNFGYGCGWVVVDRPGNQWVGHEGGAATVYGRFLQDQLSIIVLTNCRGAEPITLLEGVAAHYLAPVQTQD
jgi:CubicO group peptidase (beta-lactamase class C family)